MKLKILLGLVLITTMLKAQNDVSELITDRPDQTESSSVVPHKALQLETGFIFENVETNLAKTQSFAYNTTLLRYGLLEKFEIRIGLGNLGESTKLKNTEIKSSISGLSPLYAGFKIKIIDEERFKPEIAVLTGIVLPFTAHKNFKPKYSGINLRLAFSHSLSDRFSLGYNLGAEWDGETAVPSYFYSAALGVKLSSKFGLLIESYGLIPEDGNAEHLLDAGLTFLLQPNFQLDASGGVGIHNSVDYFISFGFTYRLSN